MPDAASDAHAARPEFIVTRMFDAIDRSDWSLFGRIFADDVTYNRPGYAEIHGLGFLISFYRDERIIASGRHDLERVIGGENGDIASWGRCTGITRQGASVEEMFSEVYCVEDGKIRSRRTFFYRPAV
jgi:ketosteroid isomerase-like protein